MIYIDRVFHSKYGYTGYLISSESINELHEFAARIGMKQDWFQNKPGFPHYKLLGGNTINKAIIAGAVLTNSRGIVEILQRVYGGRRK